jgi:hypothetical protein
MGLKHYSRAPHTGAATALARRPCLAHGSYSGPAPSAESLVFLWQVCLLKLGISLCVVVLLCTHAERCPRLCMLLVSAEIRYETRDGIYSGTTSLPILSWYHFPGYSSVLPPPEYVVFGPQSRTG